MKIITLTLNPAFDVHCHVPVLVPCREHLATVLSRDAGGKGVNISRALTENGVENIALVVLGRENASDFRASLAAARLATCEIEVKGRIRENITIHEDASRETRLSFPGFDAEASLLWLVEEALVPLLDKDCVVTLTGRIPVGIPMEDVKAFLHRLRFCGARVVIDSKSFTLDDLIECRPYLIKPNEEEIEAYLGKKLATLEDACNAAKDLWQKGIEHVLISMGCRGAVLACAEGTFAAEAPEIHALSTIGAGDSAIAGFLAAKKEGLGARDALRRSVAYGSAACLTEGTNPPRKEDVARLLSSV